ncbi:hypothetical protein LCGC14_2452370 [marine sediment metagenome]|uniref:NlpC/P60 domain-containing protein n=1 Tax=marine sediment metagenome TaxID=412755 RepID=A0A0F9C3B7_9ZZZZ
MEEKLRKLAEKCVGWRYAPRGRDYDGGHVDCFGLFLLFAREMGFEIPDFEYEEDWHKQGEDRIIDGYPKYADAIDRTELRPGDIILYRWSRDIVNHVAIFLGEGRCITCTKNAGVVIVDTAMQPFNRRMHSTYRLKQRA